MISGRTSSSPYVQPQLRPGVPAMSLSESGTLDMTGTLTQPSTVGEFMMAPSMLPRGDGTQIPEASSCSQGLAGSEWVLFEAALGLTRSCSQSGRSAPRLRETSSWRQTHRNASPSLSLRSMRPS